MLLFQQLRQRFQLDVVSSYYYKNSTKIMSVLVHLQIQWTRWMLPTIVLSFGPFFEAEEDIH